MSDQTILIVDDTPQNLSILGELLQPLYRVRAANSGERALAIARSDLQPDIILLDVMMPGMDGYEVIRQLKQDEATRGIPVIFVTALTESSEEQRGLALGAVDYITKPFNPDIVLARIKTQLELKQARDILSDQNTWLEKEIARRMRENVMVQDLTIRALAALGEIRDLETGLHIVRTQRSIEILAHKLKDHPRFRDALAGNKLQMIVKAAPLHDIGKVGIPDAVLQKPGKLTPEEYEVMKAHPVLGANAIESAIDNALAGLDTAVVEQMSGAFEFLRVAQEICRGHHEKWDGSGYPAGLAGEDIPVSARLMALADVFDALMSRRVYKDAMALENVTAFLVEERGRHFDPDVVDAYLAMREQFAEIANRFHDEDQA
ncbi:MAG: response regulator [Gallionella sp.]|nr:response regulator [Gallionella sp.]